jgi:hypothetical protein
MLETVIYTRHFRIFKSFARRCFKHRELVTETLNLSFNDSKVVHCENELCAYLRSVYVT